MIKKVMQEMIQYFGQDVRRINHALKVYGFAGCIAGGKNLNAQEALVVDLAAILHDIGIREAERKHHSNSGHYQEIEGPAIARSILSGKDLDNETIERVCFIIGHHHSYQKIDGPDFQILVEADLLVNIHEDSMEKHSVERIRKQYFKTHTGISMIESMYL